MPTVILRSLAGRIGLILIMILSLYPVGYIWLADGYGHGLVALSWAALLWLAAWLLWWRPQAQIREDAVYVRNAWRSYVIGWEVLRAAPNRWGLAIEVRGAAAQDPAGSEDAPRRINVTACTRGGLFSAMRTIKRKAQVSSDYTRAATDGTPAPTYRTHLDCDDAGHLIDLYQAAREDHLRLMRRLHRREERLAKASAAVSAAVSASEQVATDRQAELTQRWDPSAVGLTVLIPLLCLLLSALL